MPQSHSLDISKMEPLWFHNASVMLVNPRDKSVSVGWDDVKKNWENAFNFWSHIKVTQTAGPYVRVDGNVAWSTGLTNTNAEAKNGTSVNSVALAVRILAVDDLRLLRVRTAHALDRLLRAVPPALLVVSIAEWVIVGDLPHCGLRAVALPVALFTPPHSVKAAFVLPVVIATAQGSQPAGPFSRPWFEEVRTGLCPGGESPLRTRL